LPITMEIRNNRFNPIQTRTFDGNFKGQLNSIQNANSRQNQANQSGASRIG